MRPSKLAFLLPFLASRGSQAFVLPRAGSLHGGLDEGRPSGTARDSPCWHRDALPAGAAALGTSRPTVAARQKQSARLRCVDVIMGLILRKGVHKSSCSRITGLWAFSCFFSPSFCRPRFIPSMSYKSVSGGGGCSCFSRHIFFRKGKMASWLCCSEKNTRRLNKHPKVNPFSSCSTETGRRWITSDFICSLIFDLRQLRPCFLVDLQWTSNGYTWLLSLVLPPG